MLRQISVALSLFAALPSMVLAQSLAEPAIDTSNTPASRGTTSSVLAGTPPATQLLGSWPGYARGTSEKIALIGDYALLAGEAGLSVLNISDPAKPLRAGWHSTEGRAKDIAVSANFAYIAVSTGMEVYDITDPSMPMRVGHFEKAFGYRGIHVVGQKAYLVAELNTFEILDTTDPRHPVSDAVLPLTSAAVDLEVAGRYAYIANDFDGLKIIDVNDPHAPTVIGHYQTPGPARDVTVANGHAYVANLDDGLSIVNVSNPAQPSLAGSVFFWGGANAVSLAGDYLWVAADYGGVKLINVTNAAQPWMSRDLSGVPGLAKDIVVRGGHAYVAAFTEFVVMSAGYPATVGLAGQLFLGGFGTSLDAWGDHLYLADDQAGLQVLDVTNPAQPILKTNLAFRDFVQGVRVEGKYAYFTHGRGLGILDISNPGNPQQIADYGLSWSLESFCLAGNLAYAVNGVSGLEIIDISNPAHPALIGNIPFLSTAVGVFVVGDYAYVADWGNGLKIIDITNPVNPVPTGVADTPGDARDVYVKAGYAYVADTFGGLQIIDVRNPSNPAIVSSVPSGPHQPTYAVEVIGSYAYIAQGTNGLAIYDISNPSSPTLVSRETRLSTAISVRAIGTNIYVASGAAGVTIFENLLPTSEPPQILAQPRSQTVAAGSDTALSINASGSPPLGYQWHKGQVPIPGAIRSRLTLTNVSTADAGSYSVGVSNSHGEILSSNAVLTVIDLGPNFIDHFDPNIDAPQWSQLEGIARANDYGGNVSPPHSLWFSGNGGRSATTRPLDTRNGAFVTFWLRLADGTAYPWENSPQGVVFEYSVDDRASWTIMGTFSGYTFYGWQHLTFDVPAAARTSRAFFRWRELGESSDCCDHWALDDVAIITSASEPLIISQPQSQQVFTARSTTLKVVAAGATPLSYQWRHNGQDIRGATQSVYTISATYGQHAGLYSVVLSNGLGVAVSSNVMLTVVDLGGKAFRIDALNNFQPVRVEHQSLTGDDRGGIATSAERVFYSGDNSTAGFLLAGLTNPVSLGKIYDALVSDLQTGKIYSLANGTNLLGQTGGIISTLVPLNATTLQPEDPPITLSQSIPFTGGGIFAGYGRVVLWDGVRVWQIDLPSGQVSDLGPLTLSAYTASESWAFWGVAEFWGGSIHLVYVQNPTRIVRTRVPDGYTGTVATFANLGDTACFTVSVPLQRWYFHYQGTNQFGGTNETLAYANAALRIVSGPTSPIIIDHPAGQFVETGHNVTLIVGAFGSEPMRYQWRFNGTNIPGANSFIYPIDNFQAANAGNYDVIVSNDAGTNFSAAAGLSIPRPAYLSALPNVRLSQRGAVNALAQQQDGKIIIGGTFDWVNEVARSNLARIHPDGSVDPGWNPNPDNSVQAIHVHGSNIFVAGFFLNIGGQPARRLAKLDAVTGQADPNWQPNPNTLVRALSTSGDHLFVGGSFTQILGQTRISLAKLSLASPVVLDPVWNPAPTGAVTSLAVSGSDLYVGGSFTNIGGQNRRFIARLSTDGPGVVDPNWNPNPTGSGLSLVVAIRDNDVFVAGSFSSIGGQSRGGLAKLSASGVGPADPLWNPRVTGAVQRIVVDLDRVFVAGTFNGVGGLARTGVAALDRQGTGRADAAFNADVNGSASALALAPDGLWVGGNFRRLANTHALSLGKVDPQSGAPVVPMTVHRSGVVQAIARQPDGKVVFGGIFDRADNLPRGNVARLDENGLLDPLWNPDADGSVSAIATSADAVFLGGFFSRIGGGARVNLARVSPDQPGLVDPSWNANVVGGSVSELHIAQNSLFAAGSFTSIGGLSRRFLAKLNPVTALVDPAWNPNPNNTVIALAASTTNLYVGGQFTMIGFEGRAGAARLDLFNTGRADSWRPSVDVGIDTIYLNDSACFLGGTFVRFGSDPLFFIAQFTTSAPALEQGLWRPRPSSTVSAITGHGLDLYGGGSFTTIGGESRGYLARLNPGAPGQADPLWRADADLSVRALNADAEGLYVGGFFSHVAGQPRGGLAFISNEPQTPFFITQPENITAASGETIELAAIANGTAPLRFQWSLNGTNIAGATNRTYIISVAGLGHTGNYQVVISNDFGSESSDVAHVEVIEAPVLSITAEPNAIRIRFLSNTEHTYTLQRTDALGPPAIWSPVPNAVGIPGTGGALTLTHEAPTLPVRGFYRVVAH